MSGYVGRFAPTPSGALHAGSLVAALGSWLDARAHEGQWLLRIEDVDGPRTQPGAAAWISAQLDALGLRPDGVTPRQSVRGAAYQRALHSLVARGMAYPCACTRQDIEQRLAALSRPVIRGEERVYPGTCRGGTGGRTPRAWRLRVGETLQPIVVQWHDRRLGAQQQDLTHEVGDFVLRRADGPWAYQLAVVVDDAEQGITHVVRGEDLADNTARQIHLQRLLDLPTPRYLHLPLAWDEHGEKLSKSKGAKPLEVSSQSDALAALRNAAGVLNLPALPGASLGEWLAAAVLAWRARHGLA